MTVRTMILRAAGTNCDVETAEAFWRAGSEVESIHINALLEDEGRLERAQILAPELLEQLKGYAKGSRIGFLSPDILTGRKEAENCKKSFGLELTEYYAKDYEDYKKGFAKLQDEVVELVTKEDKIYIICGYSSDRTGYDGTMGCTIVAG